MYKRVFEWWCVQTVARQMSLELAEDRSGREERVDAALRALADANRRRILALVRDQPRAVGEIAESVAMSQQAVSFHLRVLRGAGLVTEQRQRTRHLFTVRADALRDVREFLDDFWPTHLAALKNAAEAEARRKRVHATQDDG